PFGAGCVLVPATEDVHLLSSWDDSIPDSVPFDHLYGVTWNPAIMAEEMAAIPGLAGARTQPAPNGRVPAVHSRCMPVAHVVLSWRPSTAASMPASASAANTRAVAPVEPGLT
ncbi:MAG: hypothetical protein AAGK32_22485, partial [Actinomycetota bacterium]